LAEKTQIFELRKPAAKI